MITAQPMEAPMLFAIKALLVMYIVWSVLIAPMMPQPVRRASNRRWDSDRPRRR